jgi:hypothetical protein
MERGEQLEQAGRVGLQQMAGFGKEGPLTPTLLWQDPQQKAAHHGANLTD